MVEDRGALIRVFETSDVALLPVIKSVLDAAGIPYVVQGDEALALLPLGPFGAGIHKRAVGAIVLVSPERAAEAARLLRVTPRRDP